MKNNLLYLVIAMLALNVTAFSQSFTLKDSVDNNILNNGNIVVNGDTSLYNIKTHVKITNNSASSKNVKIRRKIISMVTGSVTSVCWAGQCVAPNFVPTNTLSLAAGADSTAFESDFLPYKNIGTSIVAYTFYNTANVNDTIGFTITYNIAATSGIADNTSFSFLSKPYPNPANSSVNFNYKLDNNKIGYITIHNILGEQVKKVNLTATDNGEINIATSNLKAGAYFYSYVINNKTIKTGKLIINR